VLAARTADLRDFSLAEDALQDAVEAALKSWPEKTLPDNPAAWLIKVARRSAIDRLRRERNYARKQEELALLADLERQAEDEEVDETIPDERLRLIFTCCHPALAETPQKTNIWRSKALVRSGGFQDANAAVFLRRHHGPSHVFAVSPTGLAKIPELGMGWRRIAEARDFLISTGDLILIHKGGKKGPGDADQYRLEPGGNKAHQNGTV